MRNISTAGMMKKLTINNSFQAISYVELHQFDNLSYTADDDNKDFTSSEDWSCRCCFSLAFASGFL